MLQIERTAGYQPQRHSGVSVQESSQDHLPAIAVRTLEDDTLRTVSDLFSRVLAGLALRRSADLAMPDLLVGLQGAGAIDVK